MSGGDSHTNRIDAERRCGASEIQEKLDTTAPAISLWKKCYRQRLLDVDNTYLALPVFSGIRRIRILHEFIPADRKMLLVRLPEEPEPLRRADHLIDTGDSPHCIRRQWWA